MSDKPKDEVVDAISPQPHPPFPEQEQDPPGLESRLDPRPRFQGRAYRPAAKLKDRVALITGGDSGIGRSVAVLFAREGADVAIVYLEEEQSDAEETRAHVEDAGRRCLLLPGDVTDPGFCQEAVERTVEELGRLDILVNNAAFQQSVDELEELEIEQFERTFHTNIFGYFYMAKAAVPRMQPGSCIIQTGSITGLEGHPSMLDYSSTKGAIHAFTKSLARNLIRKGIRVNAVAPGPVWTPLNPADRPAEDVAEFGSGTAYGRPGQPEELAPTYVFLASNADSGFMTGEVLALLGGQTVAG